MRTFDPMRWAGHGNTLRMIATSFLIATGLTTPAIAETAQMIRPENGVVVTLPSGFILANPTDRMATFAGTEATVEIEGFDIYDTLQDAFDADMIRYEGRDVTVNVLGFEDDWYEVELIAADDTRWVKRVEQSPRCGETEANYGYVRFYIPPADFDAVADLVRPVFNSLEVGVCP